MNWGSMLRSSLRVSGRALGVIVVIGLAAFLFLSVRGVPRRFTDRWLGELRAQGYDVAVDRIRLDLLEGVVADNFSVRDDEAGRRPVLEAERVALGFNPLDWLRHKVGLRRLRVYHGLLRLDLAETPAAGDAQAVILRQVNGDLALGETAWQLNSLSADLLGIKISSRGRIRLGPPAADQSPRGQNHSGQPEIATHQQSKIESRKSKIRTSTSAISNSPSTINHQPSALHPPPSTPTASASAPGAAPPVTRRLGALTRSQREQILELVQQLNAIAFSVPPQADITFQLDMENPAANTAAIRAEGAATRAFGIRLDQWRLLAELKDGRLLLHEAVLQQRGQSLACSGSYTFAGEIAEARLRGRLILDDWLTLAPRAWRDALEASGISIAGPVQCDVSLDPAPANQVLKHLHGWLALAKADVQGLWIEQGLAGIRLSGHTVDVDPFYIVLGKGAGQGFVQGHLSYALDSGDFDGQVETRFDPRLLAPLLGSNLAEYANGFAFQNDPLVCNADFSGRAGRPEALWIAGRAQASDFAYHAVPVTSARTDFDYANGRLAFAGGRVSRPEGSVTGRLSIDLDGATLDLEAVSTANPRAIARLIGPEVSSFLDGFHFAGPMRLAVRGKLDYETWAQSELRAEIDGRDWGYRRFHAERASLTASFQRRRLDLTDIRGEAFEGEFSGQASCSPDAAGSNFCYRLSGKVNDVNLNTLLQALGYEGREEYEGLIYSECVLAGAIGRGETAAGGGWIRVQDGKLFQLRLLGGFSRLLAAVSPGMGTVELTDFAAGFTVTNRQVATTNAVLSGPTLAIHGDGRVAYDRSLDAIVWAQMAERKRFLPRLIRDASPALGRLFAVRLTGTLSDPKWWPLNLTKEQLLSLPKDLLVDMPKNVLVGLPHDLLVTLPRELLVELPRELFINLPEDLFIRLPQDLWNRLRPAPSANPAPK